MQSFHLFVTHVSAWFAILIALDVHVNGLPNRIFRLTCPALILSFIMGLVTFHGHLHYLQYLKSFA